MTDKPWPGDELVWRVSNQTDRDAFFQSGQNSVHDLQSVLAVIRRDLASFSSILDFGCGCGRIMLWLADVAESASLHGSDIDERAIEWCTEHIPYAEFRVNQTLPPLPYADASFDLVFSSSVFTHIDETYQDAWLAELRRVTRPGGHLLLTVHGEEAFLLYEKNLGAIGRDTSAIRRDLSEQGISFLKDDAFVGGPFPDCYHSTFHAPWYVFEHWGRYFEIVAVVPKGSLSFQDFLLLRRNEDGPDGKEPRQPITVARHDRPPAPDIGPGPEGSAEPRVPLGGERLLRVIGDKRWVPPTVRRIARRARSYYSGGVSPATLRAIRKNTTVDGVPVTESTARLWDALRAHGDRVTRLETDMWNALRERHGGRP